MGLSFGWNTTTGGHAEMLRPRTTTNTTNTTTRARSEAERLEALKHLQPGVYSMSEWPLCPDISPWGEIPQHRRRRR